MTTATGDARVAELQQKLGASQQVVSRLENELSQARSALEREKARPKTPLVPVPPPVPPPAPAPSQSPSLKVSLAAANARASQLEEDLQRACGEAEAYHLEADRQRGEVRRLQEELSNGSSAQNEQVLRDALGKARREVDQLRAALEDESERRRSLQRRLEDAQRNAKPSGPLRVPEPPPPPRGTSEEEDREATEADARTRRLLDELDGRLGKLEHRKINHEQRLEKQVRDSDQGAR